MKIAVVCGGTGGHVVPGLATAALLRADGHDVAVWLSGREVETGSMGGWDGAVVRVPAAGLPSGLSLRAFAAVAGWVRAFGTARRTLRAARPDAMLAMGGYASVGPVLAARALGVPVVLHEANAVPGRAVSALARAADAAGITFESARRHFRGVPVTLTGLPVREALRDAARRPRAPGPFTVLVMGGSQGAQRLNALGAAALIALHRAGRGCRILHLAGAANAAAVEAEYRAAGVEAQVVGFTNRIEEIYLQASVALSRSGAGACTELALFGIPALLVPLPEARRDHQAANARELAATGGAVLLAQKGLEPACVADYIARWMDDGAGRAAMEARLRALDVGAGARRLADLVVETAARRHAARPS